VTDRALRASSDARRAVEHRVADTIAQVPKVKRALYASKKPYGKLKKSPTESSKRALQKAQNEPGTLRRFVKIILGTKRGLITQMNPARAK